jgi:hypothetical protein
LLNIVRRVMPVAGLVVSVTQPTVEIPC